MSKEGTKISWMTDGRNEASGPLAQVGSGKGGTLNSVVGCSPVSPGCANCYAVNECWRMAHNSRVAKDYNGIVEKKGERVRFTGNVNFLKPRLMEVLNDGEHHAWFVNSLSDLFHENLSEEIIIDHLAVCRIAYWEEFRILTKRQKRLLELAPRIIWPPNVQMGVTVENIDHLVRIPALGKTGAVHKFVSFEPWLSPWPPAKGCTLAESFPREIEGNRYERLADLLKAAGIECCIVGGESDRDSHHARYMDLRDAKYILEETKAAKAHPCLKQLGTRWAVASNTVRMRRVDGEPIKGANHGAAKELWPEDLQQYSQNWPFLPLEHDHRTMPHT